MRVSSLSAVFLLARFSTLTVASIIWNSFPSFVDVGQPYDLSWTATVNYTYQIQIYHTDIEGNRSASDTNNLIDHDLIFNSLQPNYVWTVPSNLFNEGWYWFRVFGAYSNISTKMTSSNETDFFQVSYASVPNVPGPSTTSGGANPSSPFSFGGGSTSSTSSASSASSTATLASSSSAHLSGGAIAGIVIGIVVLIALSASAVIFTGWRKKRSAFQKREAEARANRLAPVLQKGASESVYEMHGRSPQTINKEMRV